MLAINWANVALITVFGIGTVFFILLTLVVILTIFGKIGNLTNFKKPLKVENQTPKAQVKTDASESEKAAIAMALHLYFAEVHDSENPSLTLKTKKSAWNDKMFGMNNLVK